MIIFTMGESADCTSCGHSATYGFTVQLVEGPQFLCTGCAPRFHNPRLLDAAVEAHRIKCFEDREREVLGQIKDDHHRDMVIAGWLDYTEEMSA